MTVVTAAAPKGAPRTVRLGQSFAMFRNGKSLTGLGILGFFTILAIFGPWIAPYDPSAMDLAARNEGPSWRHLLGTTHMGQDVFSQIIIGTRGVLVVGFLAGIIATIVAVIVGVTAGYVGGAKSESLSALTNVFLVIPGLPLVIIVASQFENPSLLVISSVLALTGWAWGARVLRAQTLSLRNRDFVQAARANGEPVYRVIAVEMLPNLTAIIASSFVGTVTAAILAQTTLAFIGVTPISDWNWGTILFWAQSNNAFPDRWWWFVPAGLCIALVGMALSLINFGIDEYVNPRLRSAGERARALRKLGIKEKSGVAAVLVQPQSASVSADATTEVRRPAAPGATGPVAEVEEADVTVEADRDPDHEPTRSLDRDSR